MQGGYHLLLKDFVANDIKVDSDIILTGSNASCKSTFMKMLALNIVLSKGLETAAAEQFILPQGDLYTSMNLEDSIMAGDSYFISEIKSLKRILQQVDRPVYIFIDEILRGTNTKERVASAEAILRYLNDRDEVTLITATHDIELTAMLEDEFDFYYFSETLTENNDVEFDYKLKRGVTKTSNAIELMRIYDYPESIYQGARETVRQTTRHKRRTEAGGVGPSFMSCNLAACFCALCTGICTFLTVVMVMLLTLSGTCITDFRTCFCELPNHWRIAR